MFLEGMWHIVLSKIGHMSHPVGFLQPSTLHQKGKFTSLPIETWQVLGTVLRNRMQQRRPRVTS